MTSLSSFNANLIVVELITSTGFMNFEVVVEHALFDGVGDIKTFASEDAEELVVSFSLYINEGVVYVQFVENEEVNNKVAAYLEKSEGVISSDDSKVAVYVLPTNSLPFTTFII